MKRKYQVCETYEENIDFEEVKKSVLKDYTKRLKKKNDKPIYIIPFGSGSTGNSYYIEIGSHSLMIDMGVGVRKVKAALEKHGRSLEDVEAILITHAHFDHRSAIRSICNNTHCKLYATKETFEELHCITEYKAAEEIIECDKKMEIKDGLYIKAFKTDHDIDGSCGYVIESEGHKVSYATDLGIVRKNTITSIGGSDVIILESNHDEKMLIEGPYDEFLKERILSPLGHLSNRQSLEFQNLLYELGTRNFLLAHLSRENNSPELLKELTDEAHKDKDINVHICKINDDELLKYQEKTMKIAVFCGSTSGKDPIYKDAAKDLGSWIGENKYTLVYGGGDAGLMGEVAKAAHDKSEVIGVVPGNVDFIKDRPQIYVDKLIEAKDMSDRKHTMFELGDVFIALPGGVGTLDEISETVTLTRIGLYNKPSIFFNRNSYYEPLKKMFEEMEKAGFVDKGYKRFVLFSDDFKEIEDFIRNFK